MVRMGGSGGEPGGGRRARAGPGALRTRGSRAERSPGGSRGRRRPVPPRRHLRAGPGGAPAAAPGRVVSFRAEPPGPAVSHRPGPGHHFPLSTGAILAARRCGEAGAAPRAPRPGGTCCPGSESRAGGGDAAPRAAGGGCRCLDGRPRPGQRRAAVGRNCGEEGTSGKAQHRGKAKYKLGRE